MRTSPLFSRSHARRSEKGMLELLARDVPTNITFPLIKRELKQDQDDVCGPHDVTFPGIKEETFDFQEDDQSVFWDVKPLIKEELDLIDIKEEVIEIDYQSAVSQFSEQHEIGTSGSRSSGVIERESSSTERFPLRKINMPSV